MCEIQWLSDGDLLALMVGPKTAQQLLKEVNGSLAALLLNEAAAAYDPKPKVQAKLKAARELVRRSLREALRRGNVLSSPAVVRDFLRVTLEGRDHEVFLVVFMDAQNRVIATEEMFRGTLTQTSVYPREVVKRSLFHNAGAVIFAHNHPSGIAEPSRADEALTQALKQALALVDVKVLDHFVVGTGCCMSFAERGLI
jgi:DNA repair protein RadC